jgi:hypothetical protein
MIHPLNHTPRLDAITFSETRWGARECSHLIMWTMGFEAASSPSPTADESSRNEVDFQSAMRSLATIRKFNTGITAA